VSVWLDRIMTFQKDRNLGLDLAKQSQLFINQYHNEGAIGEELYDELFELIC